MAMVEVISIAILTMLGISGIFAYIYSQMPEEQQHFRILFLMLSLLMCIATLWSAFAAKQVTTAQFYDETGMFIGNQSIETELDAGIKDNIIGVGSVLGVIFGLILFIIMTSFAFEKATAALRKNREKKGFISDV